VPRVKNEICFIFLPDAIGRLYLEAIKKSNQSTGGETHTVGAQACQTRAHPTPELPLFIYLAFNIYLDLTHSLPPAFKWLKQWSKSTASGFGQRWVGQEHPSSPALQRGREVGMSPATCPPGSLCPSHSHRPGCPTLSPTRSLWPPPGRTGSSGATVNRYFPFIPAEADESGREPSPAALPPPYLSPNQSVGLQPT